MAEGSRPLPKTGLRAFLGWLFYYRSLAEDSRRSFSIWLWALSKVVSNRLTYGNWASGSFQS
jgi:hypothetical protein